eukprot:gene14866-17579_t
MSEELQKLVAPHIDSYNFFVDHGMRLITESMAPVYINKVTGSPYWRVKFSELNMAAPHKAESKALYPMEAREAGVSYNAALSGKVVIYDGSTNRRIGDEITVQLGNIPVMVRSTRCHLRDMTPAQLLERHEEAMEVGGYFITNGNEKVVRMLVGNKANHPVALDRKGWSNRGPSYTKHGLMIRCVRPDRSSITNNMHYLSDGQITFRFLYRRQEYFIPVTLLLRALVDTSDLEMYNSIVQGANDNTFLTDRVELMLRQQKVDGITTQAEVLDYIGSRYRHKTSYPDAFTNREVAQEMINTYFLVHLPDYRDKFNMLIVMIQKLYSTVQGRTGLDNIDGTAFHEALLAGHIFSSILRERLTEFLETAKFAFVKAMSDTSSKKLDEVSEFHKALDKSINIGERFDYFLATGNLVSSSGLDLQQTSGFTVIADKLNFLRYIAHFRSIHRGAFFATMKTTSIRKLMPESFGFLCPVHTPDGAPCGLLNHLSSNCLITIDPLQDKKCLEANGLLSKFLLAHGVTSIEMTSSFGTNTMPVIFNGRVIGRIEPALAGELAVLLRYLKSTGTEKSIPDTLEVAYAPKVDHDGGQYPGLYLFSTGARFMRPVTNLTSGKQELVGPAEQLYMEIAMMPEEVKPITTHVELGPTAMLSVLANLTPFSDYNQSPRNMYQCQMAKQTMGTPMHAYAYRSDNKLYKIQNPQKPIVRTINQEKYRVNDYPHGANAVIAVISNTGYDMEDAMIINKSAYERGFAHGSVYKTEYIDLDEGKSRLETGKMMVARPNALTDSLDQFLDSDGLPPIGRLVKVGEPYYTTVKVGEAKQMVKMYKGKEDAYIDDVKILGGSVALKATTQIVRFIIKLRYNRNPVIGDKFASRHGQKGVLSQLWPEINMPFNESGMKPDIIINPNAFPSRMTIGMLVEIMAAKAGAIHGHFQDATAFQFNEKHMAINYFGEQLKAAGYNYYGNETMYSGTSGEQFHADIFFGICYYQRLRHMVKDKYQVRSTGKVNSVTRQPVKGRKVGGGIRFGEMERDSMLAHGSAFCLNDRLMKSSDVTTILVCKECGSTLSVARQKSPYTHHVQTRCIMCNSDSSIVPISVPYVFTYLIAELASVNISMKLTVK